MLTGWKGTARATNAADTDAGKKGLKKIYTDARLATKNFAAITTVDASTSNAALGKTATVVTTWWKKQVEGEMRLFEDFMDVFDLSCLATNTLTSKAEGNYCTHSSLTLADEGDSNK